MSGYEAQGVYYPTKNAVDAFGKGIDSEGKKLSFRLEGAENSLESKFNKIISNTNVQDNLASYIKKKYSNEKYVRKNVYTGKSTNDEKMASLSDYTDSDICNI